MRLPARRKIPAKNKTSARKQSKPKEEPSKKQSKKRGKIPNYDPLVVREQSKIARKKHQRKMQRQRMQKKKPEGLSVRFWVLGDCTLRGDQARIFNEIKNKAKKSIKYHDFAGNRARLSRLAKEFFERINTKEIEETALRNIRSEHKLQEEDKKYENQERARKGLPQEKPTTFREYVKKELAYQEKILEKRLHAPQSYINLFDFIQIMLLKKVLARAG